MPECEGRAPPPPARPYSMLLLAAQQRKEVGLSCFPRERTEGPSPRGWLVVKSPHSLPCPPEEWLWALQAFLQCTGAESLPAQPALQEAASSSSDLDGTGLGVPPLPFQPWEGLGVSLSFAGIP